MIDRLDDHHARGTGVAQCVMMPVPEAEKAGQDVQTMAVELRPGPLCNPNAVEPGGLDHRSVMDATGCCKRALVETGMGNCNPPAQMAINGRVNIRKIWLANNMVSRDPVNTDVELRKFITGINEAFIGEQLAPVAEPDNPDLADAADARASGFNIDHDKIWRVPDWRATVVCRRRGADTGAHDAEHSETTTTRRGRAASVCLDGGDMRNILPATRIEPG
jgi:hypothetical protein